MVLVTLAVIGEGNSPLYLRDFKDTPQSSALYTKSSPVGDESNDHVDQIEDPFSLLFFDRGDQQDTLTKPNNSSSLHHKVRHG
jgi:hypothetical protein